MSLIKKNANDNGERKQLVTEAEVLEGVRVKNRAYQKERRELHLDKWKDEKLIVDSISGTELYSYINKASDTDLRVGLHSMKVSAKESAIIKLAMEMTGARSSRELYINYCKEIINKGK